MSIRTRRDTYIPFCAGKPLMIKLALIEGYNLVKEVDVRKTRMILKQYWLQSCLQLCVSNKAEEYITSEIKTLEDFVRQRLNDLEHDFCGPDEVLIEMKKRNIGIIKPTHPLVNCVYFTREVTVNDLKEMSQKLSKNPRLLSGMKRRRSYFDFSEDEKFDAEEEGKEERVSLQELSGNTMDEEKAIETPSILLGPKEEIPQNSDLKAPGRSRNNYGMTMKEDGCVISLGRFD